MSRSRFTLLGTVTLGTVALSLGFISSPAMSLCAAASPPADSAVTPAVRDIALGSGGALSGQVVNSAGAAMQNATVSLQQQGQELASGATDAQGMFSISGLRGGNYELVVGQHRQHMRLWAAGTAPPAAVASTLLVNEGQDVARGQIAWFGALVPTSLTGLTSAAPAFAAFGLPAGMATYAVTQSDSGS